MPIAMSNYANRQSPNQQAKIASMLNAAAQSQRPDQFGGLRQGPSMPSPRQDIGPAPEFEKRPYTGPGPTTAPPISQSLGRMQQAQPFFGTVPGEGATDQPPTKPSAEPTKRRYKVADADNPYARTLKENRLENQRAQREARDAAGGQAGGSWPEDQARQYAPYPIHYETGEPMTDRAGDMVQDYHDYMTAGSSFVPSGPPSPDSPGRGTQYGEDIAGRTEPEYTHNVANRQTPAQHIGGQYRGAENTYITLSGGEQQQYQQFGYIDINGIRYARGPNGEMMNMGGSPEFGTPGVTNPGQGY